MHQLLTQPYQSLSCGDTCDPAELQGLLSHPCFQCNVYNRHNSGTRDMCETSAVLCDGLMTEVLLSFPCGFPPPWLTRCCNEMDLFSAPSVPPYAWLTALLLNAPSLFFPVSCAAGG